MLSSRRWATHRAVDPFVTWVAMSDHAWPAVRERVLSDRMRFLDAEIEREHATVADLESATGPEANIALSMVRHGIDVLELERAWLEEVSELLS